MTLFCLLLTSALLFLAGCSQQANGSPAGSLVGAGPLANTRAVVIRSQADLDKYLQTTAMVESPLGYLSPQARTRFLESLTFNKRGITGFRYDDLRTELSGGQIYQVLRLFGEQQDTDLIAGSGSGEHVERVKPPTCGQFGCDYPGYYCQVRATCVKSQNDICTHNC